MNHECIAAFLDNEPFDAEELRRTLATEEGRAFLIDSLALRDLVQPEDAPAVGGVAARKPLRWLAVAAAVALCTVGGYWMGQQSGFVASLQAGRVEAIIDIPSTRAPEPTEVIRLEPGVTWHAAREN